MLGNRGKHLPHSLSHRLPLLLMSDIFPGDEHRHIMSNDRSRAQAPHGLGRTSWLYYGKEYHTTIFTIWEELCSSVGSHMVLSFRVGASRITKRKKGENSSCRCFLPKKEAL
jgi:hypothetical protein